MTRFAHGNWTKGIDVWVALAVAILLLIAYRQEAQAQTYTVIHSFQGTDGDVPSAGLTMDRSGNFYGTTRDGGSYDNGPFCEVYFEDGCGTVFRLSKIGSSWLLAPVFLFNGRDGAYPITAVTIGPNGGIYGSTGVGGQCTSSPYGCGTIFDLAPPTWAPASFDSWSESVLHTFTGNDDGGPYPSNLIFDSAGNMYGTTTEYLTGNVFEFTPSDNAWTETVLYSFRGGNDGKYPHGVVADRGFNHLYGTTFKGGGIGCGGSGCGTIFELTRSESGWTETVLHTFTDGSDGAWPTSAPILDAAGNLYGTTPGAMVSPGTVWEMSPSNRGWTFSVLYTFAGRANYGPYGGLAMDAAGNLYGTTYADGRYNEGNVFRLGLSNGGWSYTDLYDFTGGSDGGAPEGNVTIDANGTIYGTTTGGGLYGVSGVVWQITP
jgi:uncharacterized repeat protein (TIGR03803 family)